MILDIATKDTRKIQYWMYFNGCGNDKDTFIPNVMSMIYVGIPLPVPWAFGVIKI